MIDYRAHLEPNNYYHIFNHAVGNENLFVEDKNYVFFLNKFEKYIVEFVDVFAYCLMPNHFHFLIRVKDIDLNNCQTPSRLSDSLVPSRLSDSLVSSRLSDSLVSSRLSDSLGYNPLSNAFKKFFTSYTNSFNKVYNKRGSLFQPRFKRRVIEDENHLLNTVIYIHNNPVSHGFVDTIADWPYSSYNNIVEGKNLDWFKPIEVIGLFDDISNFIFCHNRNCDLDEIEK